MTTTTTTTPRQEILVHDKLATGQLETGELLDRC